MGKNDIDLGHLGMGNGISISEGGSPGARSQTADIQHPITWRLDLFEPYTTVLVPVKTGLSQFSINILGSYVQSISQTARYF